MSRARLREPLLKELEVQSREDDFFEANRSLNLASRLISWAFGWPLPRKVLLSKGEDISLDGSLRDVDLCSDCVERTSFCFFRIVLLIWPLLTEGDLSGDLTGLEIDGHASKLNFTTLVWDTVSGSTNSLMMRLLDSVSESLLSVCVCLSDTTSLPEPSEWMMMLELFRLKVRSFIILALNSVCFISGYCRYN